MPCKSMGAQSQVPRPVRAVRAPISIAAQEDVATSPFIELNSHVNRWRAVPKKPPPRLGGTCGFSKMHIRDYKWRRSSVVEEKENVSLGLDTCEPSLVPSNIT